MAPRQTKSTQKAPPDRTLVVDNGAYTIKAGYAVETPNADLDCHVVPNCIARSRDKRIYVAAQLEECKDFGEMAFRRPVEKGYVVNWEVEKEIWDQTFIEQKAKLNCDPSETNLILTEAPNSPQSLQSNCDQMIFEEFGFAAYYRCVGASLNAYHSNSTDPEISEPANSPGITDLPLECLLVIDSGYSHTVVTPLYQGHPIQSAVRRLDVGGKLLTNYLKELISIRHFGLMEEPYIVNEIKEKVCFVSSNFQGDLDRTWKHRKPGSEPNSLIVDYVLPDYDSHSEGYTRPHDRSTTAKLARLGVAPSAVGGPKEDVFPLGNERFVVPELLFTPSDIGLKQAGLPRMILQSLEALPENIRPAMVANMMIVGGNANIPGFIEKLESEVQSLIPAEYILNLRRPKNPVKATWIGGAQMASNRDRMKGLLVSREDYEEHGQAWVARQFNNRHR